MGSIPSSSYLVLARPAIAAAELRLLCCVLCCAVLYPYSAVTVTVLYQTGRLPKRTYGQALGLRPSDFSNLECISQHRLFLLLLLLLSLLFLVYFIFSLFLISSPFFGSNSYPSAPHRLLINWAPRAAIATVTALQLNSTGLLTRRLRLVSSNPPPQDRPSDSPTSIPQLKTLFFHQQKSFRNCPSFSETHIL